MFERIIMQGTIKSFKQNSQNAKILEYLKSGNTLTCLEAMQLGFSHNLRSRVSDLKRAGYDVISTQVNIPNGFIAEYSLEIETASGCCNAPIIDESIDMCSACYEHCEVIEVQNGN